jgi:hypothetical protein
MQVTPAGSARARKQGSRLWVWIVLAVGVVGLMAVSAFLLSRAAESKAKSREARTQCSTIRNATILYQAAHGGGPCPNIKQLEAEGALDPSFSGMDPWGSSFKIQCTRQDAVCTSPGPDRTLGTPDDIRDPPPPEGK